MKDIHQALTDQILEQLQQGVVPWQKPWKEFPAANLTTRKAYRGINALLLNGTKFECPFWLTFKQAHDLGGTISAGAKAKPIVFYKFLDQHNEDGGLVVDSKGRPKQIPMLRYSNVFNLEQTKGIPFPELAQAHDLSSMDRAERIVEEFTLCPIVSGKSASYSPSLDRIQIPSIGRFQIPDEYFHTLFHEMGHSTGHPDRLARPGVEPGNIKFGSDPYSKEELIAEMSACFLSNEAGILKEVVFTNSAAYIGGWLKALESEPRMVLAAASQAQRAVDMVRGHQIAVTSEMDVPIETPSQQTSLVPALARKPSTRVSIK